jgi:hypothetical protein
MKLLEVEDSKVEDGKKNTMWTNYNNTSAPTQSNGLNWTGIWWTSLTFANIKKPHEFALKKPSWKMKREEEDEGGNEKWVC